MDFLDQCSIILSMLNKKLITIGKLKQAYELNNDNIDDLLEAFLTDKDKIFPYALWKRAHDKFWAEAIRTAVSIYGIEAPLLPVVTNLPEEHYPYDLHTHYTMQFFSDLLRTIKSSELERGVNYIMDATYGGEFPHKEGKDTFFSALSQDEWSQRNRTSGYLKIESTTTANYSFISASFIDTITVDKKAAILWLESLGYSLRREVQGISHALVKSILAEKLDQPALGISTKSKQKPTSPCPSWPIRTICVPRALWEEKNPESAFAALKETKLPNEVIAHILYNRMFFDNKTEIGKWIFAVQRSDSAYIKRVDKLLSKALKMSIIDD